MDLVNSPKQAIPLCLSVLWGFWMFRAGYIVGIADCAQATGLNFGFYATIMLVDIALIFASGLCLFCGHLGWVVAIMVVIATLQRLVIGSSLLVELLAWQLINVAAGLLSSLVGCPSLSWLDQPTRDKKNPNYSGQQPDQLDDLPRPHPASQRQRIQDQSAVPVPRPIEELPPKRPNGGKKMAAMGVFQNFNAPVGGVMTSWNRQTPARADANLAIGELAPVPRSLSRKTLYK